MENNPIKILIAEDSNADRLILQKIVEKQGHQVVLASDGEQAVEKFKEESPQIVLLDVLMPRMDGFEAAKEIKAIAGDDLVPIIFLTSLTDSESLAKGLSAGGDDFISKPYDRIILKAKIEAFNRMRVGHQQLQLALKNLEKFQARLVEREKMASLGELVAGIAHEVNTPIGIGVTATSHLSLLIKELSKSYDAGSLGPDQLDHFLERATESITITETNLNRAAELIRSFKQVAVDQSSGAKRKINLLQHLNDILLSLRPHLKKVKHRVTLVCEKDLSCTCDAGALTQILTNLIMNSLIHAFIGIESGNITIKIELQDQQIKMTYRDDGVGMDEACLEKIYEPFFTTRRGQGGSGLGANIIFNQVNQALHGNIETRSQPGKGTQFYISFPQNYLETPATKDKIRSF